MITLAVALSRSVFLCDILVMVLECQYASLVYFGYSVHGMRYFPRPFPCPVHGAPRGPSAYAITCLTRSKALIIKLIRQVTVSHEMPKLHRSRCTATE